MSSFRRPALVPGIYDEVVSEHVAALLAALKPPLSAHTEAISASAPPSSTLTSLLNDAIDLALRAHEGDTAKSLALARDVLSALQKHAPRSFPRPAELALRAERLRAIVTAPAEPPTAPRGSLHAASLIVNADGDALLDHLRSEFASADRVDLLCSFVKVSGFERLRSAFELLCVARARPLRVLTTTYMGASEAKAIERIASLPNTEVKVSFDEAITRLHAKAWVFHRESGFSTAYVGSSNLSHAAQTDGLEWNVRVTQSEQPALVEQIAETFEQYWSDRHMFEPYDPRSAFSRDRLVRALSPSARNDDGVNEFLAEIEAKDFQKPVLEELDAARALGRHRNLVVAATGTGKTVMAAIDYRALRANGEADSLLYVAHRREILEQARRVFRAALQLRDFGELLCEGERPRIGRHVFASIDSLREGAPIDVASFDMVIVDEAHHSAADTWQRLLARAQPKELLGLTGTPERADGIDYEHHFPRPWIGNLRVWNAIPHALVPFRYYMLDVAGVDLRDVAWTMGRYASDALAGKLIGAAEVFVQRAVRAVQEHVGRPREMRAIAFCANVRHAEEVARRLREANFKAQALTGTSPTHERRAARADLDAGLIEVLCVVDIYNEGVDVPNVNTLFFFRPTESATVFLQQLGRGLRRAPGKSELVVFDLTGRQRMEFRFDRKLRALLGHTPRELREFVDKGFGRLPSGCFVEFEEQSREEVLAQIERAVPDDRRGLQQLLREPAHASLSLDAFLIETEVAAIDVYRKGRSWFELRASVGLDARPCADDEAKALANVHKLLHVGDERRLQTWEALLAERAPTSEAERRMANMLYVVLYGKEVASSASAADAFARHAILRGELAQLIPVLRRTNALLAPAHALSDAIPLVLHARYLGVELSAAFDHRTREGQFRDYFTGVEKTANGAYDLLLTTLAKSAATQEHLRYRDFPLSETQFHWQSKSDTTQDSTRGRRHLDPVGEKCTALLFVRERNDERPGVTMAFCYLGPVEPEKAEGERPITMQWRLRFAMPAALLRAGRVAA